MQAPQQPKLAEAVGQGLDAVVEKVQPESQKTPKYHCSRIGGKEG